MNYNGLTFFNYRERKLNHFLMRNILLPTHNRKNFMNYYLQATSTLFIISVLLFIHKDYLYRIWTQPKPGTVIILNGSSASGKSTLQKAIQKLAPVPYLSLGIDNFFNDVFPDEHGTLGTKTDTDFQHQLRSVEIKENIAHLKIGSEGQKIVHGMNAAIAAYAKAGNNIVVDYIMYDQAWMEELLHNLNNCPTYLVGVKVPLEVVEQREKNRSTSPIGHAKSHYNNVHIGNDYDMWIDNTELTPEQGALQILNFISSHPK